MEDRVENWRDVVLGRVHFRPDWQRIGQELADHWEDHREDLVRIGYPQEEAERRALAAMGNPAEVGKALDQEYSPLLGWLWVFSRWMMDLLPAMTNPEEFCAYILRLYDSGGRLLKTVTGLVWDREEGARSGET